jgi:hypothetical protein
MRGTVLVLYWDPFPVKTTSNKDGADSVFKKEIADADI